MRSDYNTNICSTVLDDLETAIDKLAADETTVDVERIWQLAERVEFLKLRAVAATTVRVTGPPPGS